MGQFCRAALVAALRSLRSNVAQRATSDMDLSSASDGESSGTQ
jgi:hypothetical protein